MDAKQFIESGILEAYAMGLAAEQEAKQVAEMAARYPEVKAELKAIEEALERFDKLNAVEPPVQLKEKILAGVSGAKVPVQGSASGKNETKVVSIAAAQPQSNFFRYAAAIAVLLLIGSVWYNMSLRTTLAEQSRKLKEQDSVIANSSDESLAEQQYYEMYKHQIDSMTACIAMLSTPGMKSIELKGMEVAPDAKAMVFANTTTGDSYLEIMNLPPAPEGMQYQFWGMVDGKPVDAGMIPLEGDLSGIHPMKNVPNTTAYAISLEPKGGSQQPQGKIYAMGNS